MRRTIHSACTVLLCALAAAGEAPPEEPDPKPVVEVPGTKSFTIGVEEIGGYMTGFLMFDERIGEDGKPAYSMRPAPGPTFSPAGHHLAYTAAKGPFWIFLDGVQGPGFERIDEDHLAFSPDGERLAYAARDQGTWYAVTDGEKGKGYDGIVARWMAWSPDSRRLAYVAVRGEGQLVVVDGKEGPVWDVAAGVEFSPDGSRVVYAMKSGERMGIVEFGQEPARDALPEKAYGYVGMGSFTFSADSQRFAYLAGDGKEGSPGRFCWVVDGKELGDHPDIIPVGEAFVGADQRFQYVAQLGEKWHVFTEGKPGPAYDRIYDCVRGPGGRTVLITRSGEEWRVVVDGEPGPAFEAIHQGAVVFSPDGERVAYYGMRDEKGILVVDGEERGRPEEFLGGITFDPTGRHLAYIVARGDEWRVVVDGKDGPAWEGIGQGAPAFSPDGSRVAYRAKRGEKWHVVVGEDAGPAYDGVKNGFPRFAADGKVVAIVKEGEAVFVRHGDERGPAFGDVVDWIEAGHPVSAPDGSVTYLARIEWNAYRVTHEVARGE